MNNFPGRLLRAVALLVLLLAGAYFSMEGVRHSRWYKQRLSTQLLAGDRHRQVMAAAALSQLGAERELLEVLKTSQPEAREFARRALEYFWFNCAGSAAYKLLQAAHQAEEQGNHEQALGLLDRLTARYPRFAEGWNQRAAVHWEVGKFERSLSDCQRALALNPSHYGAWQGLGMCRLKQGDLKEACRCLRAALEILPHDQATRTTLERCEEMLRTQPGHERESRPGYLI